MLGVFRDNKNVLILGDGDFSFSKALLSKLSDLHINIGKIIATVYDSESDCYLKYPNSKMNVELLKSAGISVLFQTDATHLEDNDKLNEILFDVIVFNFPHTGGKTNLKLCKRLLKETFISCSKHLTKHNGRFCLTLADGQSGLEHSEDLFLTNDHFPCHKMDSWQAVYLATYGNFILDRVTPFPAAEFLFYGYRCTGYKNNSRQFHIENAQTLIFQPTCSAIPENLHTPEFAEESYTTDLHNFRPFYTHDISFWVNEKFDSAAFESLCRKFSKNFIKRISFLSEYSLNDDRYANENRRTLCFRLIWQSQSYAMCRESCRDMQILLRDHLQKTMPQALSFLLR